LCKFYFFSAARLCWKLNGIIDLLIALGNIGLIGEYYWWPFQRG